MLCKTINQKEKINDETFDAIEHKLFFQKNIRKYVAFLEKYFQLNSFNVWILLVENRWWKSANIYDKTREIDDTIIWSREIHEN